jgi:outer membrane lipoprotein SlyB
MLKIFALLLAAAFLLSGGFGTAPFAAAQSNRKDTRFYNGASRGVHGGNYGNDRRRYNDNRYQNNQGGIGPGKGALIGGAAGAVLGAAFGGGVQGSLITGAAGAGIGAIIGKSAQDNRQQNNYYRR